MRLWRRGGLYTLCGTSTAIARDMEVARHVKLSGHTKPYAVLGHPIGHTLSPVMHNASFQALGLDAIYLAFDVHPDRLMEVLPAMRDMGFGGVNLTVPLKEAAFRGLKELGPSAQWLGAVNTVEFRPDGTLKGHNTDGQGFLTALQEAFDLRVAGKRLFVLGCGGAVFEDAPSGGTGGVIPRSARRPAMRSQSAVQNQSPSGSACSSGSPWLHWRAAFQASRTKAPEPSSWRSERVASRIAPPSPLSGPCAIHARWLSRC